MKLTNKEWKTMYSILESRSYRYYDTEDTTSEEYKIFKNIKDRIEKSVEGSSQRYTEKQKNYLIEMLEEFALVYTEDIEDNKQYAVHTSEEVENINSMIYKLIGKKPIDLCDIMCS